jgi:hypothetical protein
MMMSDCHTLSQRPRIRPRPYAGSNAKPKVVPAPKARADLSLPLIPHQLHGAPSSTYDHAVIRFGLKRFICHLLGAESRTTIVC